MSRVPRFVKLVLPQALTILGLAIVAGAIHTRVVSGRLSPATPDPADAESSAFAHVEASEVMRWKARPLFVDARGSASWDAGHIAGAVRLTGAGWDSQFGEFLTRWSPAMPVVVYCSEKDCDASELVAARLRDEAGIGSVHILRGGYDAWVAAGGDVTNEDRN